MPNEPRTRTPAFLRLLVTTDRSPSSDRAIAYAEALARPGTAVRLLHVVTRAVMARCPCPVLVVRCPS
jgi:nucleotide-binding universal stress UspA family protein